jgi:crotonobetainyl-CoA:carnitine CoA-transferase CaiB-like acyl-CoA transferase
VWAGPYAGRLLASLGAEVTKVEAPQRPDGTRRSGFAMFDALNRGKRSLAVDLASAEGRAAFDSVLAGCDALIENFSPRVMPSLGLEPTALAQVSPGIVSVAMPAFAPRTSASDWVAYGSGLELHAGLAIWTRHGKPQVASVPYVDMLSGAFGALATIAGLLRRDSAAPGAALTVVQADVAGLVRDLADGNGIAQAAPKGAAAEDSELRVGESLDQLHPGGQLLARAPWSFAGTGR